MASIETFVIIAASIVIAFGLLGVAAATLGVDSRPTIGDDHAR